MTKHDAALATAGLIGCLVAVLHGVAVQRLVLKPLRRLATKKHETISAMVPLLLHFSTAAWLFGGLNLIAAALWYDHQARLVTTVFVGSLYVYGALANIWVTRKPHAGWILMTAALILMSYGVIRLD